MKEIRFEISAFTDSGNSTNALKHYEIEFTEPVNADWLYNIIKTALKRDVSYENYFNKLTRKSPTDL